MAGLVPAIHVFLSLQRRSKTWMPGTRPGMTAVDMNTEVVQRLRRRRDGVLCSCMTESGSARDAERVS
jgi:hypothetical protein